MKNRMEIQDFIDEVFDIVESLEGSGLEQALQDLGDRWSEFLSTTPLPESIAKWIDGLWEIVDSLEGSELERHLQLFLQSTTLSKSPKEIEWVIGFPLKSSNTN